MDFNHQNFPYPQQPNPPADSQPYMNYNQYGPNNPYPQATPPFPPTPSYPQMKPAQQPQMMLEDATLTAVLKRNRGKVMSAYMTYPHSKECTDKVFKGVIESVGKDHLILCDPKSSKRYVLLYSCFNWIEFDDEIKYDFIR